MKKYSLLIGLASLTILNLFPAPAFAFRCDGELVDKGENKAEVMIKCGDPDWRTAWTEDIITNAGSVDALRFTLDKEQWLYNLGPQRFMRILLFEGGRLVEVMTGPRGYSRGHRPGSCDHDALETGMTEFTVLKECGEPFFIDNRYRESMVVSGDGRKRVVRQRIEEWTYNLGPTRFLRILIFENGRLAEVRSGERGFVEGAPAGEPSR